MPSLPASMRNGAAWCSCEALNPLAVLTAFSPSMKEACWAGVMDAPFKARALRRANRTPAMDDGEFGLVGSEGMATGRVRCCTYSVACGVGAGEFVNESAW